MESTSLHDKSLSVEYSEVHHNIIKKDAQWYQAIVNENNPQELNENRNTSWETLATETSS